MWVTEQMYLGQLDTQVKLRNGLSLDPNNKMPETALLFWNSPNAKNPGHVRIFSCPKYTMLFDSPLHMLPSGLGMSLHSIPSAPSIPMSRRRFPFPSPSAHRGYPGLLLSLCWPHYLPSHCFQDVFPLDSVLPTDRQCILWGNGYTVYTVKWMDMCGKEPESELINSLHHLLPSSTVNYKTGSSAL